MFCSNCGKELRKNSNFCDICGSKQMVEKVLSNNFDDNHLCCPKCNSGEIQKFEAIYLQETKAFVSTGASINTDGGIGLSQSNGKISSLLSEKVKKPMEKKLGCFASLCILFIIMLWLGFIVSTDSSGVRDSLITAGITLLITIIPITIVHISSKKVEDYNNHIYPALLKKWEKSWYCNKCGNTFLKEEN